MEDEAQKFDDDEPYKPSTAIWKPRATPPAPDALKEAVDIIADARRPVIVVGRGAIWSGAGDAVIRLGDRIGALLATSLRAGVVNNPQLSASVKHQATVTIDGGVAMTSNDDLAAALAKTSIPAAEQQQIISVNEAARLDALRQAVSVIGLLVVLALVAARKLPSAQPEAPTGVPIA